MAKLMADLNHDLGTKTLLISLRNAGDLTRVKGLMMPNLLPGGHKYSSNKLRISVEITSKHQKTTPQYAKLRTTSSTGVSVNERVAASGADMCRFFPEFVFNCRFKDEIKWLENSSNVICNQERLKDEEVVSRETLHSRDLSSSPTASIIPA